jgi:integrase
MVMKLSVSQIEYFSYNQPAPRKDIRWDDSLPGFGVRIYPSEKKAFVFSYRFNNRKRLLTIGSTNVLTLKKARQLVKKYSISLIDGIDPLEVRQSTRRGTKVGDLCQYYLDNYAVQKKSYKEDQRRINKFVLPKWKNINVSAITKANIASLHHNIGKDAPYEANRVLSLIRRLFNLSYQWGFLDDQKINPAVGHPMFKETKRDRWLNQAELQRLAKTINNADPYINSAIWLYLLTGCRKQELLSAKWSDIDEGQMELKIPETKNSKPHYIPLSKQAMDILNNTPKLDDNPFIFPRNDSHLTTIQRPWEKIRIEAGIPDVRLHDLRRTVGSMLAQNGNSLHLIGRVLNHSNQATTAIYAKFAQDHVRAALDKHANQLVSAMGMD